MIGKLKGIIDEVGIDHVLVDVAGVCYLVYCSARQLHKFSKSKPAELYIETHVREDQITLFGFENRQEKNFFLKLVTVKGVGPKMALAILSYGEPQKLSLAITSGDRAVFSSVSGVGPKLANRIITELRDKNLLLDDEGNKVSMKAITGEDSRSDSDNLNSAVQALQNLGVSRSEAYLAVSKILSQQNDLGLGELIKRALKQISK